MSSPTVDPQEPPPSRAPVAAWCLLAVAWLVVLLAFREADNDLWHQLAFGAHWALTGELQRHEVFSFLPTRPEAIYHEWGCGLLVWGLVRALGPAGLLAWKALTGLLAVAVPLWLASRARAPHGALMLLAPLAAWAVLPGYMPTVRPHAITFAAFALLLAIVEALRRGGSWGLVGAGALLMLFWVNTHGGFVAGYGLIGVYLLWSWREAPARHRLLALGVAALLVSLINPWGWRFWPHHLMALAHARPQIGEWRAIDLLAWDSFSGYRVLLPVVVAVLALGWRHVPRHDGAALTMLAITALLPFSARRHVPFFAIMAVVALAPYLRALGALAQERLALAPARGHLAATGYAAGVALAALLAFGGDLSPRVRAPVGLFPVRETDILERAGLQGNVVVPFAWGAYVKWRLHPAMRVSMDSRYEVAYPEETFLLHYRFANRIGDDWDRLLREYPVDFVILDLGSERLRPGDLVPHGFRPVWLDPGTSALLAHERRIPELARALEGIDIGTMPTMDPFDLSRVERWPRR